ncbi:Fic family protein [Chloroflexales bacterium ZM16-3]|nr:Fic family protein [Chloroflexales bacterium ZM16-3]
MQPAIRMDPRLEQRIAEKRAALDRQRPLPPAILAKLADDLRVRLTYHSNAIEGNTLDLGETQLVIAHGVTIGGHSLKEHMEAVNHAAAYDVVLDLAQRETELDEAALLQLHALIMHDLVGEPGVYRRGAVFISGSEHRPPHHTQVPGLMADWFAWCMGDGRAYPPVIRATLAHEMLLAIHPFLDGNGRTARLVLSLQMMRAGYPVALLLQGWRLSYIHALEQAHHGRYSPLVNVIGRAVEAGLDLYLDACDALPDELRRPLREVAEACVIDAGYLGWLLRAGRVSGAKRSGRWYVSAAAVRRYQDEVAAGTIPVGRPRHRSET